MRRGPCEIEKTRTDLPPPTFRISECWHPLPSLRPSAEVVIHKLLGLLDDGRYKSRHQAQQDDAKKKKSKKVAEAIVQELWKPVHQHLGSGITISGTNLQSGTKMIAEDATGSACDPIFDTLLRRQRGPILMETISDIIFGLAGSGVDLVPEPFLDDDFYKSGSVSRANREEVQLGCIRLGLTTNFVCTRVLLRPFLAFPSHPPPPPPRMCGTGAPGQDPLLHAHCEE